MQDGSISRNVIISKHRTSLRLEREVWEILDDVCQRESISLNKLCTLIDNARSGGNRSSAMRVFVISYLQQSQQPHGTGQQATLSKAIDLLQK